MITPTDTNRPKTHEFAKPPILGQYPVHQNSLASVG